MYPVTVQYLAFKIILGYVATYTCIYNVAMNLNIIIYYSHIVQVLHS